MATAETTTTAAVLRCTLKSDGTWKYTLPAKDLRRLRDMSNLLATISQVPSLSDKAEAALAPLLELRQELEQ